MPAKHTGPGASLPPGAMELTQDPDSRFALESRLPNCGRRGAIIPNPRAMVKGGEPFQRKAIPLPATGAESNQASVDIRCFLMYDGSVARLRAWQLMRHTGTFFLTGERVRGLRVCQSCWLLMLV